MRLAAWATGIATRGRSGLLHAASAGALATLGHAPFDLWLVSLVAFAVLFLLIGSASRPRRAAWMAWWGAVGYFAVALHWIVEPFFVDAARHGWMAPFALLAMAGGLALFWAAAAAITAVLFPSGRLRILALAGMLLLAEALRGSVLTGFPWAQPGHVLIGSELLIIASVLGAHGLTLLLFLAAACSACLALGRRPWLGLGPVLGLGALGVMAVAPPAPLAPETAPVLRLVQPNAPQHLKWLPEMVPVFFETGLELTAAPVDPGLGAPDMVIWPETSLPVLLGRSDAVRAEISQAAGAAMVLVGAQRIEADHPRNSLALLDEAGRVLSVYDKHHLVPFGEYMPMGDLMARMGVFGLAAALPGGYLAGPGPVVLDLPGELGRVFPMICYEAIFPAYIREVPRPDWIAHLTNDAWFGRFSGPYQHLALARLRAVEQGLPVLRAANTGVSAVIDSRGAIVAELGLNTAGHLDARLPAALPPTQYSKMGDLPVLFMVLFATMAGWLGACGRRSLHPKD